MKICPKCKIEKPKSEFNKDCSKRDGVQTKCKLCEREYNQANKEKIREYQKANSEKIRLRKSELYKANRESVRAKHATYYAANRGQICARIAEYNSENPEKSAERSRNRRARKRNAEGKHTAEDVRAIFSAQRGLCANCKTKLFKSGAKKYHIDHIMPLALGGTNWPSNLQCLCQFCNQSKHAKDPVAWARGQGRLI